MHIDLLVWRHVGRLEFGFDSVLTGYSRIETTEHSEKVVSQSRQYEYGVG